MTGKHSADERVFPETEQAIQLPPDQPGAIPGVIVITNSGVASQVANPRQATKRTVVAIVVGLILALPTINSILLAIQDELLKHADIPIPGWVWIAINGALAAVALIGGLITRVMAIPGVNDWIVKHVPALAPIRQVPNLPAA